MDYLRENGAETSGRHQRHIAGQGLSNGLETGKAYMNELHCDQPVAPLTVKRLYPGAYYEVEASLQRCPTS